MAHKIVIGEDLTQPYTPPADASLDQLKELAQSANAQALDLLNKNDGNPSDDDLAKAHWLATAIDTANAAASTLEAAEEERKNMIAELKGKFVPEEAPAVDPVPVPAPEVAADPVLVAAAVPLTVPSTADIARAVGQPEVKNNIRRGVVSLVAAADVPGFGGGQKLGYEQLGEVFEARAKSYGTRGGPRRESGVAKIMFDYDPSLVASGENDQTVIEHAIDESRLPGGSLVAAGGWCAPSEVDYSLLNVSTSEGLITLPEIAVSRGGVKITKGPDFGTVYAAGGFSTLTESQVIGGTTKNVYNIPCPSFTDHRMGADVAYFTGDILTQRGYPEMITDYITKAMTAFDHLTSANTIADIIAGSTAVTNLNGSSAPIPDLGALATVLGAVELQTEDMKYRGRLSRGQSVELILPFFARGIFRADLAKRQGRGIDDLTVTDAQIDELFTVRGVNPQYVYDWQDNIATGGTGNPFGSESATASTWPQTFKVLLYPAGTWVRALTPVIELSTVYDSMLLTNNQYVALFMERGRVTIEKGFDSRVVTVASNPSGLTSGYVAQTHPAAATPI